MKIMTLICALLLVPSFAAPETVYQWTDKDGNVQYSDKPPPSGTRVLERTLEPIPNVGTVNPAGETDLPAGEDPASVADSVEQYNNEIFEQRMDATNVEEALAIECNLAQGTIDKLSSGRAAKVASPDGSLRDMSEAERKERIRMSQHYIDEYCL